MTSVSAIGSGDLFGAEGSSTANTAASIDALYRDERDRLYRLAVLLTHDSAAADDLVQEAFVSLARRWKHLAEPARAAGYLRMTVVNSARSRHRRRARWSARYWSAGVRSAPGADEPALLADEHAEVGKLVMSLPPRQQQAIALRYWGELTDDEIARQLGIAAVTVRSNISRGLRTLARLLDSSTQRDV